MPIVEFLKRLLTHVTAAATVLCIALAVGEYLVPGSVLPFLDLVDLALVVAALNVATALLVSRKTKRLVS
jgi:hypothetical protein